MTLKKFQKNINSQAGLMINNMDLDTLIKNFKPSFGNLLDIDIMFKINVYRKAQDSLERHFSHKKQQNIDNLELKLQELFKKRSK